VKIVLAPGVVATAKAVADLVETAGIKFLF
jgi:hypothetical protein